MSLKAVIFDLDGTLLNTIDDLADAMNSVLIQKGFSKHPVKEYKTFVGDGIENLVRRALPIYFRHNDDIIRECVKLVKYEYDSLWNKKSELYPGINILLDNFEAAKFKMSIYSNKPDEFVQKVAKHYFTKWDFKFITGAKKNRPLKPDTSVVKEILAGMGVTPDECLYIGDTDTDIMTGKNAGIFTIGALWGFRSEEELAEAGADFLAGKPEDIIDFLLKKTA
ncbi:MAG: HAD family hydrolase [Spirochaetes bacterium]|nr:HAD family hydrolase [Spirochaetota bacterium]